MTFSDLRPGASGRSFSTDVALLTGVRLGSVAAAFLTNVLAARMLGAAGLGAAAVAITVATISALIANAGLGISSVYFLGRRPDDRTAIVGNVATMAVVGVVVAALLVVISTPLVLAVLLPGHSAGVLIVGALVAGTMVAADVGAATLLGLHARGVYMAVEAARTFGTLLAMASVLAMGFHTEEAYMVAIAAATAVAALVAWTGSAKICGALSPRLDATFVRESLSMGVRGQAGNVFQFVNLRLSLLLVSAFLRIEAAGIYLIATRVAEVVVQLANAVSVFIFPRVAAQPVVGDTGSTERATRVTLLVVAASAIILAAGAEPLLHVAFGPAFVEGATALRLSLLAMVPLALSRIVTSDLKGRGRADLVSLANLFALLLSMAFGLVLIPTLEMEGAAIAAIATYSGLALALLAAYRRVTRAPLTRLVPRPHDAAAAWALGRRAIR